MIQHHGDRILRLAGVTDITIWIPRQAELVQLRRFPDGVIEVPVPGLAQPDVFILEVATYPDARVPSQAVRDVALVYLERDIVPEVIVLFLREKGHVEPSGSVTLHSRRGLTQLDLSWKAVQLWEIPAEELILTGDIGLMPWAPLAQFSGPPEPIVSRCRAHLDHGAAPIDRENLLTATQFLLALRYNEDKPLLGRLRALLGGRQVMIESPLYQEIVEESERTGATRAKRETIVRFLVGRFGPSAKELQVELNAVELDRLDDLAEFAAKCRNLAAFRKRLLS